MFKICFFVAFLLLARSHTTYSRQSILQENLLTSLNFCDEQITRLESQLDTKNVPSAYTYDIDALFMIDCTGSMGPYINMARDKTKDLIKGLRAQYSRATVRVSVVGYRDISDSERFKVLDFTSSANDVEAFLDSLQAQGGADGPEDVNGGMQISLYRTNWKALTRFVYHLADAPCHGKWFHDDFDDYPFGLETDKVWVKLFSSMKRMDINYLYFNIQNYTTKTFNTLKDVYSSIKIEKPNLVFNSEPLMTDPGTGKPEAEKFVASAVSAAAMAQEKNVMARGAE